MARRFSLFRKGIRNGQPQSSTNEPSDSDFETGTKPADGFQRLQEATADQAARHANRDSCRNSRPCDDAAAGVAGPAVSPSTGVQKTESAGKS